MIVDKRVLISNFLVALLSGVVTGFSFFFALHFMDMGTLSHAELSMYESYMGFFRNILCPIAVFILSYMFGENIIMSSNLRKIIIYIYLSSFLGNFFGNVIGMSYYLNLYHNDLFFISYVSTINSIGTGIIFLFISFSAIFISNTFKKQNKFSK
ncbi:hypothetical protein JW865_00640 [Candidatus Bathyarchaeota archaeon]|nr:hypothetical protein [Candidatus Bathyarchaeota archaeon]